MYKPIFNPTTEVKVGFGLFTPFAVFAKWTDKSGWSEPRVVNIDDLPKVLSNANAIHYGGSVFEGMKAHEDSAGFMRVFRAEDHFLRLNLSAERMSLPTLPAKLFFYALEELIIKGGYEVDSENGQGLYIRPVIFNSTNSFGPYACNECYFIITTASLTTNPFADVKCIVETEMSRASMGGVATAKTSGNYAACALATKNAREKGYKHVLWTDGISHQYVEEFNGMNMFFVKNQEIRTPHLGRGTVLRGITRETILEVANYQVNECDVSIDDFISGINNGSITELFGTGTASTIVPFSAISYKGKEYNLPKYSKDSILYKLLDIINSIYAGSSHIEYTTYKFTESL
ncbi:MAG: aminotransferase class IV [Candidatus Nomurabacteria bacterium]|nr:aminotransferase class IV [Candidatus Nomurabacteria bacterium]